MITYELVPKLIRAALNNDKKTVESIALMIGRKIKKEYPQISSEIMQITANSSVGADNLRTLDLAPAPVDRESRNQLVKVEEPIAMEAPVLNQDVYEQINDFLKERELLEKFLEEDIIPPNSMLLSGKPGVGKTYIAKWLSYKLNLPVVTVDLATSISSYLGRSGQNIKSIFDYAKSQNVILFLDELDAIAKRRDDMGDLGELKRLVNVLLKELEECPVTCVIVGATNHPEILDKAIWRRFDRNIIVPLPGKAEREKLINRTLGRKSDDINNETMKFIIDNTESVSASEVCKMCEHIKRQVVMNEDEQIDILALKECCRNIELKEKSEKIQLCRLLKRDFPRLSLRDISNITLIPSASVGRYLKEK
ncbi:MAG: AAA family ATPase [Lachnospiraceae bacterium]|nr:AAA family ATPase [Lachnospiraceae bacterium]